MGQQGRGLPYRPTLRHVGYPAYRTLLRPHASDRPPARGYPRATGGIQPRGSNPYACRTKKAGALMTSNTQSTGPSAELAVHEEGRGTVVVEIHGELTRDTQLERFRSAVHKRCDDDR